MLNCSFSKQYAIHTDYVVSSTLVCNFEHSLSLFFGLNANISMLMSQVELILEVSYQNPQELELTQEGEISTCSK